MPRLRDSAVQLDPGRYRQIAPQESAAAGHPAPVEVAPYAVPNTMMISSLPGISTDVDGITRQFYRGGRLPVRRLVIPG